MDKSSNFIPELSIIIPVYNVEDYLHRCVDSILSQDYDAYEIILVDDGSTDSSGSLCDELARQHKCIRVIHKPNGGLSSARNAGLRVAQGRYIWFIDSDDYIAEKCLDKIMTKIKSDGSEIIFFSHIRSNGVSTFGSPVGKYHPGFYTGMEVLQGHLAYMTAWSYVSSKSLWDENNLLFLEGINFEDFEIWPRLLKTLKKGSFLKSDIPPYIYYVRPGSIMNQSDPNKRLKQIQDYSRIENSWKKSFDLVSPKADSYDMLVLKEGTATLHRFLLGFTLISNLPIRTKLNLYLQYRKKGVFSGYYNGHRRNPYVSFGRLRIFWSIIGRSFILYSFYSIVRDISKKWKK
ncbi:glycosyl transferase family 2 [Porphyromonas gingivalis]|uniref:glycosyltransferase family 2 protein n=1 Tax=Porphyromonas gingivalis TaxID=837 RepID=UPI000C17C8D1|nr:glycosyltransferase family 2 protein [Porphyromonas gingivalis]ATR94707.1 glycosyl transferase family 2 [Porphyromonas gingivalis]ATR97606.1 glycosyl transferase family 2 [Porphyromonas gingivalis]